MAITVTGKVTGTGKSLVGPTPAGPVAGDAAVFAGGFGLTTMDYITISTGGDATSFGDLVTLSGRAAGTSNSARGVFASGQDFNDAIEYITILTPGDSTDFGNLTQARYSARGATNGTNNSALIMAGYSGVYSNVIDRLTVSSAANAVLYSGVTTADQHPAATSNGTNDRAVMSGGHGGGTWNEDPPNGLKDAILWITISTSGNAVDYGTLPDRVFAHGSTSNDTNDRAVFVGGRASGTDPSVATDVISQITISTGGTASAHGSLTIATGQMNVTSNGTNERAVTGGGADAGGVALNVMEWFTISSASAATEFGDLTSARAGVASASNTWQ